MQGPSLRMKTGDAGPEPTYKDRMGVPHKHGITILYHLH